MAEFGEVRDFATGIVEAVDYSGRPGCGFARMQTEQRIWDGKKWCALHEGGGAVLGMMLDTKRQITPNQA